MKLVCTPCVKPSLQRIMFITLVCHAGNITNGECIRRTFTETGYSELEGNEWSFLLSPRNVLEKKHTSHPLLSLTHFTVIFFHQPPVNRIHRSYILLCHQTVQENTDWGSRRCGYRRCYCPSAHTYTEVCIYFNPGPHVQQQLSLRLHTALSKSSTLEASFKKLVFTEQHPKHTIALIFILIIVGIINR